MWGLFFLHIFVSNNKNMRTFKFQNDIYKRMTLADLNEVINYKSNHLLFHVNRCIDEKIRRNARL